MGVLGYCCPSSNLILHRFPWFRPVHSCAFLSLLYTLVNHFVYIVQHCWGGRGKTRMMRWASVFVHPQGFWSGPVWASRRLSRGVPTLFPTFSSLQFVIASKTFQSPSLVNFTPISFTVNILLKLWRFDSFKEGFRNFYQSQRTN